jgi:hypothetical protein
MTWKPKICIYHGGCPDGFTAAWAIWRRWGREVRFIPATYGKPIAIDEGELKNADVLFVDFSLPFEAIEEWQTHARSIVILDHHKTAQEALETYATFDLTVADLERVLQDDGSAPELPRNVAVHFDSVRSGAMLAWIFAFPRLPPPLFVKYIQDRDLWLFNLGDDSRAHAASVASYVMNFETWEIIVHESAQSTLIREGRPILRAREAMMRKFLDEVFYEELGGHRVPCVNVPYEFASDTANALLWKFPDAAFAAAWFIRGDGLKQYSLRSEASRTDVAAVAEKYGGGGHRNAAGFQVPFLSGRDSINLASFA